MGGAADRQCFPPFPHPAPKLVPMSDIDLAALKATVQSLPERVKGPGGVVGVVKDGEVVLRHAWGFADLDRRVPMTTETLIPICSISKQFTCAALLDVVGDPAKLDAALARHLPNLEDRRPTVADLCNNQSGLRDYWALTVLHGAMADGVFAREDTARLFARMRRTHFEPGTSYSYSNGNFRILSDLIEEAAGKPLAEVYRERLFGPAGMETAILASDTAAPLNGVVGYEGNDTVGYFPAVNRIFWSGDAGIAASLDDMLAWEHFIDRTRDDPDGLYNRLSAPQPFGDGTASRYGFGLSHETVDEIALTGHGGALRGFRARRLHAASERLSVVVMFNHEADAHGAATVVARAALGRPEKPVAAARPGTRMERQLSRAFDGPPAQDRRRREGAGGTLCHLARAFDDGCGRHRPRHLHDAHARRRHDPHGAARRKSARKSHPHPRRPARRHCRTLRFGGTRGCLRDRLGRRRLVWRLRRLSRQGRDAPDPSGRQGRLAPVLPPLHGRARHRATGRFWCGATARAGSAA